MGIPDVEQAKRRLQDILRKAQKFEIPTQEVISTRTARKLLARSKNALAWTIWIGIFVLILSGVVYARWPTQEVETVRTVLRRTVSWVLIIVIFGGKIITDFFLIVRKCHWFIQNLKTQKVPFKLKTKLAARNRRPSTLQGSTSTEKNRSRL